MAKIDRVEFGEIVIDGRSFYSDVTISAKGEVEHIRKRHRIGVSEVVPLMKGADCIVIGTGMEGGMEVDEAVGDLLASKNVKLFCDNTQDAVEVFNGLVANRKKVAGLFHVTS